MKTIEQDNFIQESLQTLMADPKHVLMAKLFGKRSRGVSPVATVILSEWKGKKYIVKVDRAGRNPVTSGVQK